MACGIRADHENLQVDNCELWAWDKWAIDLAMPAGAHVHHNSIHHTRRWGYGYGVWVRGGGRALIEANLFDFNRHHIGSGAQATSSYEARYNICLDHDVQPSFDRHGDAEHVGETTLILHNEFRDPDMAAILLRGTPTREARFHHNWFAHATRQEAIQVTQEATKNVVIGDNFYGVRAGAPRPPAGVAVPRAGYAPLNVSLNAGESEIKSGRYEWNLPDTAEAVGVVLHGASDRYTFQEPGVYPVSLTIFDTLGIPNQTLIPVTVLPPQGGYVLSLNLKDSYSGTLKGYYQKQVLIDGVVVWEADVADDGEAWQHLLLDVSRRVRGKQSIDLSMRLTARQNVTHPVTQIVECFLYVDDVHLFGGNLQAGDFETDGSWMFRNEPAGEQGFRVFTRNLWTGEARSGKRGCVIGNGYGRTISAGALTEVRQNVPIDPAGSPPR